MLSRNLAVEGVGERDHGGWKIVKRGFLNLDYRNLKVFSVCLASLEKKKILEKRIMKKQKREGRIEEVTEEEGLRT